MKNKKTTKKSGPKKGAVKKWSQKLKDLGEQTPPKALMKILNRKEMQTFVLEDETPVEKILNERNLITAPLPEQTAPVVMETSLGKIRIEGEVTPQKLALAQQFDQVFQASVDEIMDLASMTPNADTMDFVKTSGLTNKQVEAMKKAEPWTTFQIKGETLLKTTDNKIENVKTYFFRLERAVIQQINMRKEAEATLETVKKELASTQSEYVNLKSSIREDFRKIYSEEQGSSLASLFLPIKNFFSKLVTTVTKLLS